MAGLLPQHWLDCDLVSISQLAPLQWLQWPALDELGIRFALKREDLLHPHLSGNKLYKLYAHLRMASQSGYSRILTFGGAWSNHIYALAAAGQSLGLETRGVIRGERPSQLSATLRDAEAMGMQLHFISRADYRRKGETAFLAELQRELGPSYVVPEGGGDLLGATGCMALGRGLELLRQEQPFDTVCCAVGTGGTLAGLAAGLSQNVRVCGFSVLKGEGGLAGDVAELQAQLGESGAIWCLESRYHCGGYARCTNELAQFMQEFELQTDVKLDPVYTAKMMWGIMQKARAGEWPAGSRILALHSGGLQGRRGFPMPL